MSPTVHHATLNHLWHYFFKVVEKVKPIVFVVENVPEFLKAEEFKFVLRAAKKLGYHVDHGVRNAAQFGVPQHRKRGFLIGAKGFVPRLPIPDALIEYRTVKDAIGGLLNRPPHESFDEVGRDQFKRLRNLIKKLVVQPGGAAIPRMPLHSVSQLHLSRSPTDLSLRRYKAIPRGGNRFDLSADLLPECWRKKVSGSADVMGRLEWNKPSVTIRTEFFKPEKGRYLHPELHRPITHLEAARLQTFPDSYLLCGSRIQIARQIGNAVPPLLALALAEQIKYQLTGPSQTETSRGFVSENELCELQITGGAR